MNKGVQHFATIRSMLSKLKLKHWGSVMSSLESYASKWGKK